MNTKLQDIARASIVGTHAFEVLKARKTGAKLEHYRAEGFTDKDLAALVEHQRYLLRADPKALLAWADGRPSAFDPSKHLAPLLGSTLPLSERLPVYVAQRHLAQALGVSAEDVLPAANLFQMNLEIDRDGDVLQELIEFYLSLRIPLLIEKIGTSEEQGQQRFMELGKKMAAETCPSPFATDAASWRITGMKLMHWIGKKTGSCDHRTIAAEMMPQPDLQALLPDLQELPAQRIAVVGHSYTMMVQWSTPAPFTWIAKAVLEKVNPGVSFLHFGGGSMSPATASRLYRDIVLEYKPAQVYFYLVVMTEQDVADMALLVRTFTDAGIACNAFTQRYALDYQNVDCLKQVAAITPLRIVDIEGTLQTSPHRKDFMSLDGIHMTEIYHRLAAVELLKAIHG
jgi:hypothetical protein